MVTPALLDFTAASGLLGWRIELVPALRTQPSCTGGTSCECCLVCKCTSLFGQSHLRPRAGSFFPLSRDRETHFLITRNGMSCGRTVKSMRSTHYDFSGSRSFSLLVGIWMFLFEVLLHRLTITSLDISVNSTNRFLSTVWVRDYNSSHFVFQ